MKKIIRFRGYKRSLIIFFMFFNSLLFTIELPKTPQQPLISGFTNKKDTSNTNYSKKDSDKIEIQAEIELFSGLKVNGRANFHRKIVFKHKKQGLVFTKELSIKDIKYIKFIRWKGYRNEKSNFYSFYPSLIIIKDKSGILYSIDYNLGYFDSIVLKNNYGKTTLFSYFGDEYQNGKWKDGTKDFNYHEEVPNKKVIKIIRFIDK